MRTVWEQHPRAGVLRRAVRSYLDNDMLTYAAALAYQALFALFPFLIFLVSLLGFLNLDTFFVWLRDQAALMLPGPALEIVNRVIEEVQQRQLGVLSLSMLIALWSASGGVRGLIHALNRAYSVKEDRPVWRHFLLSIICTLGLTGMLLLAAGLLLIGPGVMVYIAAPLGLNPLMITAWMWLRWPLALVLLTLAVDTIYMVAPATRRPFRLLSPGAIVAVLAWLAVSIAFGFYVQRIGDYNATYGSLGAVVMLIFYFYLSSSLLLFGAEINAASIPRVAPVERGDIPEPQPAPLRERAVGQAERE